MYVLNLSTIAPTVRTDGTVQWSRIECTGKECAKAIRALPSLGCKVSTKKWSMRVVPLMGRYLPLMRLCLGEEDSDVYKIERKIVELERERTLNMGEDSEVAKEQQKQGQKKGRAINNKEKKKNRK